MPIDQVSAFNLGDWVGRETGVSDWAEIDQSRISAFADCTNDFQFIHLDAERASSEAGFEGTIAHGFLIASMLPSFAYEACLAIENAKVSINYGFDKLRFIQPVPSGASVRARFWLAEAVERHSAQWLLTYDVHVEIKGVEKPALAARWLTLHMLGDSN
ncbi:MAG: MaoC family dehydratase [Proteobacteria bacterium]|jgi:acyl dehydratase|nr:MaoC family dehydratase [Pseudomonadota bacterium]MDB4825524.1 MaoC family dehydratase [Gammaproteobacteria bacterium]MBT4108078.1 MaoC family dehydratase [Pseudomonadota bacterium]MBT4358095.1 MaoC family dehydratase [Pseudomonadota bacterium]MBT4988172.1 MaoC family dehydratase [Pseudomonadota bacterium]